MANKKLLKPYQKPKIKSSKIKAISFYSRAFTRSAANNEYLLADLTPF
jgi:hypothetical protein